MIKLYVFVITTAISIPVNPQITVEPITDCIAFIKNYHYEKSQKEAQALAIYKEKKWYNWLPKPGLGYDFVSGRPMFTLAAPDFVSYINRKKELQYRQFKNIETSSENIHNDTVAFISGYKELNTMIKLYNEEELLIANDSLILQLKTEENKKLQATTEDVLKQKITLLEKYYTHSRGILALMSKAAALEQYLHRNLKINYSSPR